MITNGIDVNRSRKIYLWIYLCSKYTYMGRCAELVSQRAVNPSPSGIVGSSPTRPTIYLSKLVGNRERNLTYQEGNALVYGEPADREFEPHLK